MARSRRIILKTRTFDSAGTATDFFKEMLNRYEIGQIVSQEDTADLLALLERHDERAEKVGDGIVAFEVNIPPEDGPQFSKRCFWAIRKDESKIDFSYKHCLEKKPYD